jgi:hypothetical protein
MDQLKAVICTLLPGLWLVAAWYCPADPVSECANECGSTSTTLRAHKPRRPFNDTRPIGQAARLLNRRTGTQPSWDGASIPPFIEASGFGGLDTPFSPLALSAGADQFTQSWQFHWRTALEPRAPCSVS